MDSVSNSDIFSLMLNGMFEQVKFRAITSFEMF